MSICYLKSCLFIHIHFCKGYIILQDNVKYNQVSYHFCSPPTCLQSQVLHLLSSPKSRVEEMEEADQPRAHRPGAECSVSLALRRRTWPHGNALSACSIAPLTRRRSGSSAASLVSHSSLQHWGVLHSGSEKEAFWFESPINPQIYLIVKKFLECSPPGHGVIICLYRVIYDKSSGCVVQGSTRIKKTSRFRALWVGSRFLSALTGVQPC